MTLDPTDNAELLHASANLDIDHEESDSHAGRQRKADFVLAFERARLLVVMDGDRPMAFHGAETSTLVAFTDDEAAQWWAQNRHPAEGIDHSFALNFAEPPTSEREGRDWWLQRCSEVGAGAVALNPSGPLDYRISRQDLEDTRPPRLRRRSIPTELNAWLDIDARNAERARLADMVVQLREVVERADKDWAREHSPEIKALERTGDVTVSAELQMLAGRWRIMFGQELRGARQHLLGAVGPARLGDPYRGIDGLLESAELMRSLHDRGATHPQAEDFPKVFLSQAADWLANLRMGYRDEEIDALAQWRSQGSQEPR